MNGAKFTPGPYFMRGNSVYSRSPQSVDPAAFRGLDKPEINDPNLGDLYLIAESVAHEPTRRLLTHAPHLYFALKLMIAAEETVARNSFAEGDRFDDEIWRQEDPETFARVQQARRAIEWVDGTHMAAQAKEIPS